MSAARLRLTATATGFSDSSTRPVTNRPGRNRPSVGTTARASALCVSLLPTGDM